MSAAVTPKVSSKNNKDEILRAYNELLASREANAEDIPEKKAEITKAAETAVVEKASNYTVDRIIKGLADLNVHMGNALTELASQLTVEARKLVEIREAIEVEKANLTELHNIDVTAHTLDFLIREHSVKKAQLESDYKEMAEHLEHEVLFKRTEWKKEQEAYLLMLKEAEAKQKKEREREKEEYDYSTALVRKKDNDTYNEKKVLLEKELRELRHTQEELLHSREMAIAAREEEFLALHTKAAAFPEELAAIAQKTEADTTARIETQMKYAELMRMKEAETEKRLADLRIASLQDTVAKQNAQIEALTKKLEESSNQVQAIAVKAIEGASNTRALSTINEIAMEQAKNLNNR